MTGQRPSGAVLPSTEPQTEGCQPLPAGDPRCAHAAGIQQFHAHSPRTQPGRSSHAMHHSKALLLQYACGMRVVITSGNFVGTEFSCSANSLWHQDFPRKGPGAPGASDFEKGASTEQGPPLLVLLGCDWRAGCAQLAANGGSVQPVKRWLQCSRYSCRHSWAMLTPADCLANCRSPQRLPARAAPAQRVGLQAAAPGGRHRLQLCQGGTGGFGAGGPQGAGPAQVGRGRAGGSRAAQHVLLQART